MGSILDKLKKALGIGTKPSAPDVASKSGPAAQPQPAGDAIDRTPPQPQGPNKVPKRIIVLCDGTWNDGLSQGIDKITNVLRIARAILPEDRSYTPARPQIVYYLAGIGTSGYKAVDTLQGATGDGVITKIREAYAFIAANYTEGDDIYLVGFSRGAFTARTVAALINDLGILSRYEMEDFAAIFKSYQDNDKLKKSRTGTDVAVVAVFDTVGALGIPGSFDAEDVQILGFQDRILGEKVKYAFHAIAINETREDFIATKWEQQPGAKAAGQVMKQVWFAGSHSDIGGGWPERDLADLTLWWMLSNFEEHGKDEAGNGSLLAIDWDYVQKIPSPHKPWGQLAPHDPRGGWMAFAAPTHRVLPFAHNDVTNESYHSSVLQQIHGADSDRSKKIRDAIAADSRLLEGMMPRESELKDWWAKQPLHA